MANCEKKRIKKVRLCTGDLRSLAAIQTRTLGNSTFESSQPVHTFTTVRSQWGALETINNGVMRFAKVTIDENATHIFWCMFDAGLPDIENRNHWLLIDSKRYLVLKVENINERNETLAIQVTERGETSEVATKA